MMISCRNYVAYANNVSSKQMDQRNQLNNLKTNALSKIRNIWNF